MSTAVGEYAPRPEEYKATPQNQIAHLPHQVQAFLIFNNQCLHYLEPKYAVLENTFEGVDEPWVHYPDLPPKVEAARNLGCQMLGRWFTGELKL
jgi:hypothetical protein